MALCSNAEFREYQTDILFLLVGTNPLPNYVAALLLAKENASIYLMHTKGKGSTAEVACRLRQHINKTRPDLQIILRSIHDADTEKIRLKVREIVSEIGAGGKSVGLNYTGATKPMAVQAFHSLKESFPNGLYSYLDPRSLAMFINREGMPTQSPAVGRTVELTLEELAEIHGYKLITDTRRSSRCPDIHNALVFIVASKDGYADWRNWIDSFEKGNPLESIGNYPYLGPLMQGIRAACGCESPTETEVSGKLGHKALKACIKYFRAEFLEEYTFDCVKSVSDELGIKQFGLGQKFIRTGRQAAKKDWELDVAAIDGYQLFAISCMATCIPGNAKKHLMEVFVRARQLGGDEARFGLVCCVKNPEMLQQEIARTWDAQGKIRVFGSRHLPDLTRELKNWFLTANKGAA